MTGRRLFLILLGAALAAVLARVAAEWWRPDADRVRLLIDDVAEGARQRNMVRMLRRVSGARYRDGYHENKNMLAGSLGMLFRQFRNVEVDIPEPPAVQVDRGAGAATARLRAKVRLGLAADGPATDEGIERARGTDVWIVTLAKDGRHWFITGVDVPEADR